MRKINLLAVKEIRSPNSTPLMSDASVLVMQNGDTVTVPRPVMIGLALFVHKAYGSTSLISTLTYDSCQFYISGRLEYQTFLDLSLFYKYLKDAGMDIMSKVYIRNYSMFEHFYRRKNERVPVEVDGYQTRLIMKPHSFEAMECELDIEQHQLRNDLMRGSYIGTSEVVGLSPRPGDENWWRNQRQVQ